MKRALLCALLAFAALPAFASDAFQDRHAIVEKYRGAPPIVIGVFPGTVGGDLTNTHAVLRRYLPFANYFSHETKRIVSFVPQLDVQQFKHEVAERTYGAVYVNAEIGASAILAGYVPIARRAEDIVSAVMVPADSPIASIKDVANKRIGLVDQAMVSTLAKNALIEAGVYKTVKLVDAGNTGQDGLVNFITNRTVDGVILRKETAESAIAKAPGKYKVAFIADRAPGFILMVDPQQVTDTERGLFANALLKLDGRRASDLAVISGLDGTIGHYVPASPNDVEHMVKVLDGIARETGARDLIVRKTAPAKVSLATPPNLPALPQGLVGGSVR
jgi:ABC-type phosphate/phosphonate transport system substrate-binding protein